MADQPKRRDLWKIENTLERRAALIVDLITDQADRIVSAMDEPPPGMHEPDTEQVKLMWSFSPYPNPERTFWAIHDMLLPGLLSQVASQPMTGEDRLKAVRAAHQQAELQALQKVFPQRAKLVQLGLTTIDRSVELADRARRLVDREQKAKPQQQQEAVTY